MISSNKKGQGIVGIIIVIGVLFLLLILGLGMAFGGIVIDWVFDEVTPTMTTIGMVDTTNFSSIATSTITPLNTLTDSFKWMSGVLYVMALLGLLGLSFAFRVTGNKWLMAFFFISMFMLVIASIFISNIYEDFYDDSGDVGDALHEYTLLSYMILYSPVIMCVIGFVSGIIMFTGDSMEREI